MRTLPGEALATTAASALAVQGLLVVALVLVLALNAGIPLLARLAHAPSARLRPRRAVLIFASAGLLCCLGTMFAAEPWVPLQPFAATTFLASVATLLPTLVALTFHAQSRSSFRSGLDPHTQ
jgi:hypothetical protein